METDIQILAYECLQHYTIGQNDSNPSVLSADEQMGSSSVQMKCCSAIKSNEELTGHGMSLKYMMG